jgi:hypothetical protein
MLRRTYAEGGSSPVTLRAIMTDFSSISAAFVWNDYTLCIADKAEFLHIVAARYCDLRLQGRRPSWAFPP